MLAGVGVNGIVLGAGQFDTSGRCPKIIVELLAQVGRVGGPSARGLQQARVALGARRLRIAMIDDEVWRDAKALECGQQDRRPAVVRLAGARVGGGMIGVVA